MRRPAPTRAPKKTAAAKSRAAKLAQKQARKKKPTKLPRPKMLARRKAYGLAYRFDRAMRKALTSGKGALKDEALVQDILDGMGDGSLKANDPYVTSALESAAEVEGPVLQCGASPLTLLLAITMQKRHQYLWTLEHNPSWANVISTVLARYDIRAGQVIQAPAEAFGDHIWYVTNVKQLPRDIALVLCDGSNVLPNGMRGVVRRLEDRLSHRCQFLVRNTKRPKDLDFASKWARSKNAPFILNDKGEPFIKIALRDQTPDAELIQDRVLTVWDELVEPEDLKLTRRSATNLNTVGDDKPAATPLRSIPAQATKV